VFQSSLARSSAPGGLLKHLTQCERQPMDVKLRAEAECKSRLAGGSSPSRSQTSLGVRTSFTDPNIFAPLPLPQFGFPETLQHSDHSQPHFGAVFDSSPAIPSSSLAFSRYNMEGSTVSRVSSSESLAPSDSASAVSRPASRIGNKRRSSSRKVPGSDNLAIQPWNESTRRRFEQYIIRLTASAGFPLSWVENNVWHSFLEEFLPSAPKISRKVLTKRILPEAVKEVQEKVKKQVAGKEVTMQGDGWTGLNNQHLLAFMITCDKKVSDTLVSHQYFLHSNTCSRFILSEFTMPQGNEKPLKIFLPKLNVSLILLLESGEPSSLHSLQTLPARLAKHVVFLQPSIPILLCWIVTATR